MNLIPCGLGRDGAGLIVRVSDAISLPVPPSLAPRYQAVAGRELILGLRPEPLTEPRHRAQEAGGGGGVGFSGSRWASSSRWAWRPWCSSPSTAPSCAAASTPRPPRGPA